MKIKLLLIAFLFSLLNVVFSQQEQAKNDSTKKRIDFAVIPMVSFNNSFGGQIGVMANGYFDINKEDTISPTSMLGLFGSYFTNNTYFFGVISKNHFSEDRWRTRTILAYGNIEFQTYVDVPGYIGETEDGTVIIDYNTKVPFIYFSGMREIFNKIYGGIQVSYSQSKTIFNSDGIPVDIPTETEHLFGFGLDSEFDSRDNIMNPHTGMNATLQTTSYLESLGSSSEYHKIKAAFNKFFNLNNKSILVARFFAVASIGDVPFSGQNIVSRDDMRGYSKGEYRAKQVYNIQTEYRWNFYKKWGMVAFGGLGIATDDFQGNNYSGILPSIGTGIRFKAIVSRNINIGIDVAKGKDDWGLYFRIGEAFGR